jgi:hypothetical protein
MGIIWIEMHIRDSWILDYILREIDRHGGQVRLTQGRIAAQFSCHRHTARNIINRLVSAGKLRVDKTSKNAPAGALYSRPEVKIA